MGPVGIPLVLGETKEFVNRYVRRYFSGIRILLVSQARWEFTKVESPHEICGKKTIAKSPHFLLFDLHYSGIGQTSLK